jgi:hypothetical protein
MPNWCVNQVDIRGDEAKVAELIAFVKGTDEEGNGRLFDFAKIVPPPDSPLYAANSSSTDYVCGCVSTFVTTEPARGEDAFGPDYVARKGYWAIDGKEVKFGEKCPTHNESSVMDNPLNWYQWNCDNWGTKWNAGEVWHDRVDNGESTEGQTSYNFDTAWAPAEPVIAALAKMFPMLQFEHRYCEGGMGFAGEIMYQNGEVFSMDEYSQEDMPEGSFTKDWERDFGKIPMTEFEKFADQHFGGVVGG